MRAGFVVGVDLVALTVRDGQLQVLAMPAAHPASSYRMALPGRQIRQFEKLEAAARDLLKLEGIEPAAARMEQLGTWDDSDRDIRRQVITTAYRALIPSGLVDDHTDDDHGGEDDRRRRRGGVRPAEWLPVRALVYEEMAYECGQILREAIERLADELERTTIAASLCPDPFTLLELRQVYETVWGIELDPSNFRRKMLAAGGLAPTGQRRTPPEGRATTGRPAELYRIGEPGRFLPPFTREPTR